MFYGYDNIFWGLILMTFNIKFGRIKILPAFIGLMLINGGINRLSQTMSDKSIKEAKILGIIAIIMTLISETIEFINPNLLQGFFTFHIWTISYFMIELLLVFKILEASIEYLFSQNEIEMAEDFIGKQRRYIIVYIFNIILIIISLIFNVNFLNIMSALMALGLRIYIIIIINNLRKIYKPGLEE